jgi:transcriptional regulator with XRE-family HTH domain
MRKDLARESGVSYSQIAQIETGKTGGSEKSAKAIADAFGIAIDDIWLY